MVKLLSNVNYDRRNAYSSSKMLESLIKYDKNKQIYASANLLEAVDTELGRGNLGGIVVLSTDVNAEQISSNKIKNWVAQKFHTI